MMSGETLWLRTGLQSKQKKYLGEDTILKPLFRKCARYIDIITDPPGAKVYIKEYTRPDTVGHFLV